MQPLAIIGIGCLFPKANGLRDFWANLKAGRDAIAPVPPTHWNPDDYFDPDPKAPDRTYAQTGGFLDPYPFNPLEFGITPNDLEATDSTQLLGLVAATMALRDAGYGPDRPFDRRRVSVVLGVTGTLELVIPLGARLGHPHWKRAMKAAGVPDSVVDEVVQRISESYVGWQESSFPGLLGNVVAGRIANRLDLGGTNCVVDAACASSLSAVHLAAMELNAGRCDMVVTGGADTFNDIFMYMCFSKTPALSPTGQARPFAANADGTILGEGLGLVVLKRLADAERDKDRIYAVIRGVGTSSDGKGNAIYAPSAEGQVRCLQDAYRVADVTPDTIDLIEAHGTGTRVGDATELKALSDVFLSDAGQRLDRPWCALGSVKSQIGHTKAAAGAAGLIKAALALHHKVLPPSIKADEPAEPLTRDQSPFYLNATKRPWLPRDGHPRRAGVSAFGFGGSNFHAVLEEYQPNKPDIDWDGDVQIIAFMSESPDGIVRLLGDWNPAMPWDDVKRRAADSRAAFRSVAACRLILVATREGDRPRLWARAAAEVAKRGSERFWTLPDGVYYGSGPRTGKLAILFPGQGSQYPGMLRDLACQFPAMQETLAAADRVVGSSDGRLSDRIYPPVPGDSRRQAKYESDLRATRTAQPAIGAVSLGALRVIEGFGVSPDAVAGHSFGELTALAAARRLAIDEFLRLAKVRGELMSIDRDGDSGAMLAVHGPLAVVEAVIREQGLDLVIANRNAPQQSVVSGATEIIEKASKCFSERGLRTTRLPVSAAFHSRFVADAEPAFRAAVEAAAFASERIAVYANTTAEPYPQDPGAARALLAGQLARPVEFSRMIQTMVESEVRLFIEVGPGRVLSRLVQAIVEGMPTKPTVDVTALDESAGKRSGVVELAQILARVAAHGFQVKLASWDGSTSHPATMPPVAKPGHTIPICGANYVKPKPQRPPVAKPAPVIGLPAEPRPLEPKQKPASLQPAPTPVRVTTVTEPLKTNPLPQSSLDHALHVTRDGLTAFERLQEQTAQLHRQFLLGQDAAQQALARLIEQQQQLLLASLNGSSVVVPAPPSVPVAALPIPAFDAVAAVPVAETPRVAEPVAAPPPPPPVSKQEKAPPPAVTDVEKIRNVLLSVVAEKTGYPPEMLDLGMGLDADLGIDSIKRVEILSALQERLPDAPAVKPEHLGTLNTLQAIVDFLSNGLASPVLAAAAPVPKPVVTENRAGDAVTRTLLEVIAEKTGYPPEMLDLDMGLDADLGIDSIKRVEILSALQERMPDAPVVKPEHLGALNTLRAIVDFLVGAPVVGPLPASAPVENQALPAPIEEQPLPAPSDDRHNVVLSRRVLKIARLASEHRPSARISPGSKIWLIAQPSAYAEEMVGEIRRRGFDCHRFGWGDAQPPAPEGLGGMVLFAPELMDDDQMLAGFRWARQSAAALRRAGRAGGACFVTVSQLDGQFGLGDRALVADPVSGGLAGLAKTASHEWPDVTCRAVDVEPGRVSSATLIEECLRSGPVEVGITTDGFWETSLTEAPITAGIQTPFSRSDVILLTGGARGVTAEAAVALAEAYQPTLVVFGRSPEPVSEPEWLNGLTDEAEIKRELGRQLNGNVSPKVIGEHYHRLAANREVQANLARMKRAGARVIYRAVDVREPDEVAAAIADVRSQVGPITGLIHGAGVLADRRIDEMTDDQFRAVFDTKVNGLRHLIQAAGNDPLKAIVLYSSSTGRFGRTGQANYAVANEILNKMAQQLRRLRRECRIVAINWGPWEGGMVTPALRKVFASEGIGLIPLADGAGLMVAELTASDRATEIVVGRAASAAEVPASTDLQPAFERELSLSLAPCLASHVLDGNAVFPAALHAEWLGHSAMHGNPGLMFHGFNDIRICHGVRLAPDDTAVIRAYAGKANKRDGQFFVPVELRGLRRDGREIVHSRAEVILAGQLPVAPTPNLVSPAKPFPDSIETVYEKQLFHGRDFQGLVTIEGIDEKSIVATARTAPSPNQWLAQPLRPNWLADPLAMDVAFQLAVVWGQWRHRSPGLPASAARYRQYVRSFPAGIVRIVVRVTHDGAAVARFDIDFVETTGRMLARIEGCECVRDAGLAAAYRRNRLLLKV